MLHLYQAITLDSRIERKSSLLEHRGLRIPSVLLAASPNVAAVVVVIAVAVTDLVAVVIVGVVIAVVVGDVLVVADRC